MTATSQASAFSQWLTKQIGPCQWVVARSSKKRRAQGYDRFFTQKRFTALKVAFEKEATPMPDPPLRLTEPDKELARLARETPPGMAHWAGSGPAGKTCRECEHWHCDGYLAASGLLKDAPCDKRKRMMQGEAGPKLAHYVSACKYFELATFERPIEKR